MVMKILSLKELYESLIHFGLISINANLNQITRLKQYLKSICPLGNYYHFSERWKNLYGTTENLPLDNSLPVSPNHAGHNSPKTFMMNVCIYNQLLKRKTQHVPCKAMSLALLDAILRQITAMYAFVVAYIWKPPGLCLSGIRRFRRFCIYAIRKPRHFLGYIVINYYRLITLITVCNIIFIYFDILSIAVSASICFEFYERGALNQV